MLAGFMAFFALFTLVLYPNANTLHPTAAAASLAAVLPPGLAGGIAVLTNWTYSLFYVCAELWGDVILSLLFWGMANETTKIQDAGTIYPLLGVGANVAQASSGALMKWVSGTWQPGPEVAAGDVWGLKLRLLMSVVMVCGVGIAATHAYIMVWTLLAPSPSTIRNTRWFGESIPGSGNIHRPTNRPGFRFA